MLKTPMLCVFYIELNSMGQGRSCYVSARGFGKVDSPCHANWGLPNANTDNKTDAKNAVERNFYMDDFLR